MSKNHFNELLWFLAVAEERSFTKAAAKIGVAQSTLSHSIKRLEERMGIRLLTRTTRSVAPTEAGDRLRHTLAPRMEEIEEEIAALMEFRDKPSGTVRITLPDHAMRTFIWPKLKPVLKDFPDIKVEFSVDNALRNIVEDGFDAGIRLGESVERDMIAQRVSPDWRLVAVGSPDYFAEHGRPKHPDELLQHMCICLRQRTSGGLYAWEFEKGDQEMRVRVEGQLTFSSTFDMIDAVINGFGIAYVPESAVTEHVKAGRIEMVLEDWSPPFEGYFIYYPSRRQNLPAFRVIVDALRYRGD